VCASGTGIFNLELAWLILVGAAAVVGFVLGSFMGMNFGLIASLSLLAWLPALPFFFGVDFDSRLGMCFPAYSNAIWGWVAGTVGATAFALRLHTVLVAACTLAAGLGFGLLLRIATVPSFVGLAISVVLSSLALAGLARRRHKP
jgi:hypothetical protein